MATWGGTATCNPPDERQDPRALARRVFILHPLAPPSPACVPTIPSPLFLSWGMDVQSAVQAAQGLSGRVEAGLGEYTELEAWVASATSTAVASLRTRVAGLVEERLEDMGWGQAMVEVQRREEGEGEGEKVPLATLLLRLVRLQRAAGREPGTSRRRVEWARRKVLV